MTATAPTMAAYPAGPAAPRASLAVFVLGPITRAMPTPATDLEAEVEEIAEGDALSAVTIARFALELAAGLLPPASPIGDRLSALAQLLAEDETSLAIDT